MEKQMLKFGRLASLIIFSCVCGRGAAESKYQEECVVWSNVSSNIEREPKAEVNCAPDTPCTGVTCNGSYSWLHDIISSASPYTDVCFGVILEPCKTPVSVFVYIIIPESGVRFNATFTNSTNNYEVPGTQVSILGVQLQGNLDITMVHRTETRPPFNFLELDIKFGMILHTPIKPTLIGDPYTIVPDMIVPIPNCNRAIHNNVHMPQNCSPPPADPGYFTTPAPIEGQVCHVDTVNACPHNAMCHRTAGKKSYCICAPLYKWTNDSHIACVRELTTPEIIFPALTAGSGTGTNTLTAGSGTGTNKILYIVFGTLGAIALIGGLVGFWVIKFRRYQARYGGHTPLGSSDDGDPEMLVALMAPTADDDEPPLDITT